nr:IS110 family transposase [Dactylosporangium thailandense]BFE64942.1 IS110 family transposase [Dactylosporangium thailandense]BFE65143.1 IS110 family transposase [Dactylosporangium thailandense]
MSVTGERFAGIDWAEDSHAICVIDGAGEPVERLVVGHSKAGIGKAVAVLVRHGVAGVGIERPDGPLVAGLLAAGLEVFVVPPSQVKSLRGRYGSAGHKDDRFDAYVLADTVRTDRRRLTPLRPDTAATTSLRTLVRARADLVGHRVGMVNQLRAHLLSVLPGAVGLFCELTSPISRAFLTAFGTQDAVDALTLDTLTAWLAGQRYRRIKPGVLLARLHDAPAGVTGPAGQALAGVTTAYLTAVTALIDQITALEDQIADALAAHPDGPIFTSLPRAGTVRAARLLAEIGDARGRYPNPAALAGLAGVTPSTRQSGKVTIIAFRWAVNKQLRGAVCDFAADSRHTNPWAAHLYQQARARGHRHPHAVRILARAWLGIIWKCWTTNTPYNPDQHNALQKVLTQTP